MKSLTHSDSMRFCRRGRHFRYGIKKRSSQADEYPINGCRHQKIAEMARSHCSLVLVGNNSIMYLVSSHPLDLGADFVMHSAAKFITRHCDLMGGVLVVTGERFFFLCSWLDLRLSYAFSSSVVPLSCFHGQNYQITLIE